MASVEEKVKQLIVEQLQVDEAEVTPTAWVSTSDPALAGSTS